MAYSLNDDWNGASAFVSPSACVLTDGTMTITGASGSGPRYGWRVAGLPGDVFTFTVEARATQGIGHVFATWDSSQTSLLKDCKVVSPIWQTYEIRFEIGPTRSPAEAYIQVGLYGGDATSSIVEFRKPRIKRNGGPYLAGVARDGLRFNAAGNIEMVIGNAVVQTWDASTAPLTLPAARKGLMSTEVGALMNALAAGTPRKKTAAIDDFVETLRDDGWLAKLDGLHLGTISELVGVNVNLAQPGLYTLVPSGTVAFTPWIGPGGGGEVGYYDAVYTNGLGKFQTNNNSMGVIVDAASDGTAYVCGNSAFSIVPRSNSTSGYFYVRNGTTTSDNVAGPLGAGLYSMDRNNSANFDMLHNGEVKATKTRATATPTTASFNLLRQNGLTTRAHEPVKLFFYGQSLGTAGHLAIVDAFDDLMTVIG